MHIRPVLAQFRAAAAAAAAPAAPVAVGVEAVGGNALGMLRNLAATLIQRNARGFVQRSCGVRARAATLLQTVCRTYAASRALGERVEALLVMWSPRTAAAREGEAAVLLQTTCRTTLAIRGFERLVEAAHRGHVAALDAHERSRSLPDDDDDTLDGLASADDIRGFQERSWTEGVSAEDTLQALTSAQEASAEELRSLQYEGAVLPCCTAIVCRDSSYKRDRGEENDSMPPS
jgi:hypothetical protein